MGALRDYDEASFRHFEGVHVGRRALDQAASRFRDSRGEGARAPDEAGAAAAAARAGEREGGGEGAARDEVEVVPAARGAEEGGGDAGGVGAPIPAEGAPAAVRAGAAPVEEKLTQKGGPEGPNQEAEGGRREGPPAGGEEEEEEAAAMVAAAAWRTGAGGAAGGGSGVEPARPDAASLSLPAGRWVAICWAAVLLRVQTTTSIFKGRVGWSIVSSVRISVVEEPRREVSDVTGLTHGIGCGDGLSG